jgi:phage terminase large subunit-like protein
MTNPIPTTSTEPFFDEAEALRRLSFFPKYLRHGDGRFKGKSFDLLEWEAQIVSDIFGWKWYDPEIGESVRWHTEAFIEVGAKNGKTELGAGIALSIMLQDGEESGFVFSVAEDKDQGRIVHRVGKQFAEGHPILRKRLKVPESSRADWIEDRKTGNVWRVLPGDEGGNDGEKAIAVIGDEIHRWKYPGLYDVMRKSIAASRQGLFVGLTTAGDDLSTLWKERHDYAVKVENGTVNNRRFYSARFAADPEDPWDDIETWKKANPSLGVTKTVSFLQDIAEAARISPARRAAFKRLHLNIPNQGEDGLLDIEAWNSCPASADEDELAGKKAWAGVDLSSTTDLTALCVIVPEEQGVSALWHFWMPEETATQRQNDDGVPYREWAQEGWLTLTPGNVVDYGWLRKDINAAADRFGLQTIGYDPWHATQFVLELQDDDGLPVVPVRQGFQTLSSPTKHLLALVASGNLDHGGNPVAKWMAGNASAKEDENGNIRPDKKRSKGRIDGIVALINALSEWERAGIPEGPSVYESRGILTL